jgi:beta-phosphoglucomutase-like phosphatase (HAD superfamily)
MSADAKTETPAAPAAETPKPAPKARRAVVMELEGVAVSHRPVLLELMKKHAPSGAKVDPLLFLRHAVRPTLAQVVASVAGPLELRAASRTVLLERLRQGMADYYASDKPVLRPGIAKVLQRAADAGLPLAAITVLPETQAQALSSQLGLDRWQVRLCLFEPAEDERFPGADIWLKVAKALGVQARGSLALVSEAVACRSALAAGLRCLAAPDEFTAFQDFGGADALSPDLDDKEAAALLAP